MGMPRNVSLGGAALCLKLDSCRMMASCTCIGKPYFFSTSSDASNQSGFSRKILHAFSTLDGGVVAQDASNRGNIRSNKGLCIGESEAQIEGRAGLDVSGYPRPGQPDAGVSAAIKTASDTGGSMGFCPCARSSPDETLPPARNGSSAAHG